MNVIHMAREIAFVVQTVLPIAPLPNAALALAAVAFENPLTLRQRAREPRFDQSPTRGEITVGFRQSPDGMQVIGQNDNRADCKRVLRPCLAECRAEEVDVFGEQPQSAFRQIDGEKEAASGE